MDVMMDSKVWDPPRRAFTHSCWAGFRSLSISSSVMPMTAFMGVRISWLMVARNWLLARLASSSSSVRRFSNHSLRMDFQYR